MDKRLYLRERRRHLTEEGRCHNCPRPAEGYFCRACRLETAERARIQMRASRVRRQVTDAFLLAMQLLAENRCLECQQPKEHFHWLHCRKHYRKRRAPQMFENHAA